MEASFRRYGFLQIKEYGRQFVEYKQLVVNFANALAMTLENQWQQECLRTANIELEKHRNNLEELVEEQTGELRKLSIAVGRAFGSVIITDKNGKIEYVNQAFCKMTGFNHAEVIGKNPQLINSGKHPKQFFQELWETILSGHRWEGEICNKKKNGELFWIAQSISPVLDENGEISHFVGVSMDMTQRKKDAEQLKSYAIELQRNNKELEDFAFIASHDLQEPLRKITTFGDRLIEKTVDLDEHSRDYIERMGKSARRMKRFIEDLLLYSKVTTKQKPFELVDLEKKVKTVCEEMDHIIHSTHAVVNISNLPTIEGDNNQIHQLIVNLIFNSFKYKSEGKPPIINIFGKKKENNYWEISIQDNGIGFDEKYADRIFKPFQRLHGRSKYEGSGLGLTICKKIVERHNGTISALSKPGVGTTFILTLPEKQPPIH